MLSVSNLVGGYGAADEIVKGVSFNAVRGEVLTIIGPNGAGKSTALKLVAGLLVTKSGSVTLDGNALTTLDPQSRARHGMVFVPQEHNVFGALSVAENLSRQEKERSEDIFARFPALKERRRNAAASLSGGQRQTLAMAIAMMASPRVLLLDEPTAALSPVAAAEIFKVVRSVADEGIAVLMVEQNALAALAMSDKACVLVDGRVVLEGKADELGRDPEVRQAFLGGRG
ncbi:ABC transporter ATP-binding protein [Pelagibacterium flavum]|uniref:ABC transporter ATP-binding protein n=1 Tax=Pelagibacterium flavum TaxID=2984530 RepID=A0ABY6IVZ8_9HYPH|nr:ABC transporter ATP-binding protein [Pelagibacterium sp. YIM 151497]UYQ73865.1 ABC transporter ATP-binding protein [Pelagibacterium sp. YIM 151497]